MISTFEARKSTFSYKALCAFVTFSFFVTMVIFPNTAQAQGVASLPTPGTMIGMTPAFAPPIIKGVQIDPQHPFQFNFILDTGEDHVSGKELETEANKLIKYFLAAITVPDQDLWVNLSPYEKDRIVPEEFGKTEMGRDLLAQDYILKQFTASLIYPEDELGKKFWDSVYKKAYEKYGTTDVPVNTFNKVWIMPDKAVVYEHNGTSAFVVERHLKVMLEEDYLALSNNLNNEKIGTSSQSETASKDVNSISSDIVREILIPEIEREVNTGKNFANLRQIYNAMILSTWYKRQLQESVFAGVYANKNKVAGVDIADKAEAQKIYSQYLEAFKKGVCDYIKVEFDKNQNRNIPRKYFSGGTKHIPKNVRIRTNPSTLTGPQVVELGNSAGPLVAVKGFEDPISTAGSPTTTAQAAENMSHEDVVVEVDESAYEGLREFVADMGTEVLDDSAGDETAASAIGIPVLSSLMADKLSKIQAYSIRLANGKTGLIKDTEWIDFIKKRREQVLLLEQNINDFLKENLTKAQIKSINLDWSRETTRLEGVDIVSLSKEKIDKILEVLKKKKSSKNRQNLASDFQIMIDNLELYQNRFQKIIGDLAYEMSKNKNLSEINPDGLLKKALAGEKDSEIPKEAGVTKFFRKVAGFLRLEQFTAINVAVSLHSMLLKFAGTDAPAWEWVLWAAATFTVSTLIHEFGHWFQGQKSNTLSLEEIPFKIIADLGKTKNSLLLSYYKNQSVLKQSVEGKMLTDKIFAKEVENFVKDLNLTAVSSGKMIFDISEINEKLSEEQKKKFFEYFEKNSWLMDSKKEHEIRTGMASYWEKTKLINRLKRDNIIKGNSGRWKWIPEWLTFNARGLQVNFSRTTLQNLAYGPLFSAWMTGGAIVALLASFVIPGLAATWLPGLALTLVVIGLFNSIFADDSALLELIKEKKLDRAQQRAAKEAAEKKDEDGVIGKKDDDITLKVKDKSGQWRDWSMMNPEDIRNVVKYDEKKNAYVIPAMIHCNVINGGKHSDGSATFQEWMYLPLGSESVDEALEKLSDLFDALKRKIRADYGTLGEMGKEGGIAPILQDQRQILVLMREAGKMCGLVEGKDFAYSLDIAASEMADAAEKSGDIGLYRLFKDRNPRNLTSEQLMAEYEKLMQEFCIISIEDPFSEDDVPAYTEFTKRYGKGGTHLKNLKFAIQKKGIQIVLDDISATNPMLIYALKAAGCGNAILIKLNQIGTVTESINSIRITESSYIPLLNQKDGKKYADAYETVDSHRSGESEDTTLADLVVGMGGGQIKTGSVNRSDRMGKYNRLKKISGYLQASKEKGKSLLSKPEGDILITGAQATSTYDSNGNPTVTLELFLDGHGSQEATVPSGASTGKREAQELRDGDPEHSRGKGTLIATANAQELAEKLLVGKKLSELNQFDVDKAMLKLELAEGEKDNFSKIKARGKNPIINLERDDYLNKVEQQLYKTQYGANALLAVSMAFAKAKAYSEGIGLFQYFKMLKEEPMKQDELYGIKVHFNPDSETAASGIITDRKVLDRSVALPSDQGTTARNKPEMTVGGDPEIASSAAVDQLGGISMSSSTLDLQINRDSTGVPLPISQQPIMNMNIQGFKFNIMTIEPITTTLPMYLGMSDSDLSVAML